MLPVGVYQCNTQEARFVGPKARYEEHLRTFYLGYIGFSIVMWALVAGVVLVLASIARSIGLWIWRGFKANG